MSLFHITSTVLSVVLAISDQAIWRWFSRNGTDAYPPHFVGQQRCKHYALPDVVARLREGRNRGLAGGDLRDLVDFDTAHRAELLLTGPALHLGSDLAERAATVHAALTPVEAARFAQSRTNIRVGLLTAFWQRLQHVDPAIYDLAVLHPSVLRYVLIGEADELPTTSTEWVNWAAEFITTNVDTSTIEALAA